MVAARARTLVRPASRRISRRSAEPASLLHRSATSAASSRLAEGLADDQGADPQRLCRLQSLGESVDPERQADGVDSPPPEDPTVVVGGRQELVDPAPEDAQDSGRRPEPFRAIVLEQLLDFGLSPPPPAGRKTRR